MRITVGHVLLMLLYSLACAVVAIAQTDDKPLVPEARMEILTEDEWRQIDVACERALAWLARQQRRDGAFPSVEVGQPGVTGLCIMAFLSQGHLPGQGQYGEHLRHAVQYVLGAQQPNGLIARAAPSSIPLPQYAEHRIGQTCVYNHAIGGLVLSEVYAMTDQVEPERLQETIERGLAVTLELQRRPKQRSIDHGGWRYLHRYRRADSDLSVVGWHLMFLRSAKNSGFDVPNQAIDDAIACIRRSFVPRVGNFVYTVQEEETPTRAMCGAGILALAHAGLHQSPEALRAGQSMLDRPFDRYNSTMYPLERYHYSVFHCCQAAYQLGGRVWDEFFPRTATTLLANQQRNGSWPPEGNAHGDAEFGNAYTTALAVLSLAAPNGMLPIYQR
jgi:hypothetical protein